MTVCRWSKAGPHPGGDPDLHHYVGELLYKGTSRARISSTLLGLMVIIPYRHVEGNFDTAEPYLLAAGKRDSARLLAEAFVEWAGPEGPAGAFALRGTLP